MKIKLHFAPVFLFICLSGCKESNLLNLSKLPELGNINIVANRLESATVSSEILSDGFAEITRRGICWSLTSSSPSINNQVIELSSASTSLNASISRELGGEIYVRAFAENEVGIAYSKSIKIPWPGTDSNLPVVLALSPTSIGFYSMTLEGAITSNGGLPIIEKGFCYSSTEPLPTIESPRVVSITADFQSNLSNLTEETHYYIRAYARNYQGVGYSPVLSVNTIQFYQPGEIGPAGGIIFYSKSDDIGGWHFLEAAPSDLSAPTIWAPVSNSTGAIGVDMGSGFENTQNLLSQLGTGENYAAHLANNYSTSGFADWYLPSRDELLQMRLVMFLEGVGGLSGDTRYWSSTEDLNFSSNAWLVTMQQLPGGTYSTSKSDIHKIRPCRRF